MSDNEKGIQFVFQLEDNSQILVSIWGDSARLAKREDPFARWEPPIYPIRVEKLD